MKKTMGEIISANRKAKKMTQVELAEKMGVTDKAVSKWERDLSCPDINSLPQLAEVLGISVDELMQVKESKNETTNNKILEITDTVFKAVGLAMGIAVVVLSIMGALNTESAIIMLGIGLIGISLSVFNNKKNMH